MISTERLHRPAPKLGLLINSNDVFSPQAKDDSERRLREYFEELKASGAIHADSIVYGRIFGPHEASAAADVFAAAQVDLVVVPVLRVERVVPVISAALRAISTG